MEVKVFSIMIPATCGDRLEFRTRSIATAPPSDLMVAGKKGSLKNSDDARVINSDTHLPKRINWFLSICGCCSKKCNAASPSRYNPDSDGDPVVF